LFLALGLLALIPRIARPIALLLVAITLAESVSPIVSALEKRMSRTAAVTIVYLVLAGLMVLLGMLVFPPLVAESRELLQRLPTMLERAQAWLEERNRFGPLRMGSALDALPSWIGSHAVSLPLSFVTTLLEVMFVVFLSIYWLVGAPGLQRFMLSLFPRRLRDRASDVSAHIGRSMGGYVRGIVINGAIMGALAWVGLTLADVPYALVLAVLTMLGELVPIVGPIVVGIVVVLLSLTDSLTKAVIALVLYTALNQLEGHILTPNIMRSQTQLPQTLVLFAIVVGGALGGLLGIVVAIPVAAALRVLVVDVLAPAERRWAAAEDRKKVAPVSD
jgi:predicted PurR-regulated permease PerM